MAQRRLMRTSCLVPFCRRTTSNEKLKARRHTEWICGRHWALTDRQARRLLFRIRRKITQRPLSRRLVLQGIEMRLWELLKRQAIERAAGI